MTNDQPVVDGAPVAEPGRGPEVLAFLQAAEQVLDEVLGAVHQLGQDQEAELVTTLLRLLGRSAQVVTLVASDAVTRGVLVGSDAATTAQWLGAHVRDVPVEPRTVRAMASVADACRDRKNTVITAALRDGSCSVESARTALTQADKVAPVIPTADREEILGWYLQLDPALGCAGLTQLTRQIFARFDPDKLSQGDEKLERTESLTWSTTPTGMTRLVAELSPANAAILKDAINAKSAPSPAKPADNTRNTADEQTHDAASAARAAGGGHGSGAAFGLGDTTGQAGDEKVQDEEPRDEKVRDERSPGKRRLDALLDLVGAGARAATGEGTQSSAATVLLTMGLETLTKGVGAASTSTGDTVDAGAARRFACTADLIPAVLGGPSAPLDVGRRERLATKAIRAAVILRDGGCSFPGCDRPPGFCEVHHVRPWWAGGETSLTNSAMLCGRHHQTVHRKGYTADIQPDRVEWDLTPGLMPGHQTAAA
ncbi:hypothetical protein GCM10011492_34900 [Flexivirga endophytica]|uniref:HNH nuclease domain-containing protein n=1 Tax=Flexivirga endophytica TaxID=1849103 RepID=A0A916TDP9_9MICO|nr:HNH endonuclease signature motif containing protein [Flexivirga endophytica]GGB41061.1 hypothetical protein GCM10011492_34900 [Flexivirga endophytica]GHB48870.1 hypothetical protein GCM10008112_17280 [Flexivirga endophytica]